MHRATFLIVSMGYPRRRKMKLWGGDRSDDRVRDRNELHRLRAVAAERVLATEFTALAEIPLPCQTPDRSDHSSDPFACVNLRPQVRAASVSSAQGSWPRRCGGRGIARPPDPNPIPELAAARGDTTPPAPLWLAVPRRNGVTCSVLGRAGFTHAEYVRISVATAAIRRFSIVRVLAKRELNRGLEPPLVDFPQRSVLHPGCHHRAHAPGCTRNSCDPWLHALPHGPRETPVALARARSDTWSCHTTWANHSTAAVAPRR